MGLIGQWALKCFLIVLDTALMMMILIMMVVVVVVMR
jgi:hypothetical protein